MDLGEGAGHDHHHPGQDTLGMDVVKNLRGHLKRRSALIAGRIVKP